MRSRHGPAIDAARLVACAAVAFFAAAAAASAQGKPKVLGKTATIVGTNTNFVAPGHRKVILGTKHKDVILGTPGNDWIVSNGGADIIDGGPGNDVIIGGSNPSDRKHDDRSKLIGGAGRDYIEEAGPPT